MVWTVVGTTAMSGRSPAKALIASRELQRVTTWNSVPVSTFRLRIDARMKPGIPESLGNVSLLRWRIYASAWSGLAIPFQCLDIIVLPSYQTFTTATLAPLVQLNQDVALSRNHRG